MIQALLAIESCY